jgi:queuosine precursor transporter
MKRTGYLFFVAFVATVYLANYSIKNIGTVCIPDGPCLVPVWFGVMAPSGVLFAGLALTLRDVVQRHLGFWWSWIAVAVGAGLSAFLDPSLAIASGGAFFLAETLDLFVYTPLQRRNLYAAVIASNVAGLVVDSVVFLALAGLPMELVVGMVIGKAWMTLAAIPAIGWMRRNGQTVTA